MKMEKNCLKTDKYRPLKYLLVLMALAGIVFILINIFVNDDRIFLNIGLLLTAVASFTNVMVFRRKDDKND